MGHDVINIIRRFVEYRRIRSGIRRGHRCGVGPVLVVVEV